MDDDLELLPIFTVKLGDVGGLDKDGREIAEVPVSLLVDTSIPVLMVAEGTRAAVRRADTMESRVTMIALYCVRDGSRCWGTNGSSTDTGEVFIIGREIIFGTS